MAIDIEKSTDLTTDVYGINDYVNEIKKLYTPDVSEDTLLLGIFGYLGQIHSDMLQNSIVMASEFSNESIATRAKFEKNIIAHALGVGYSDINATPSTFNVALAFIEDDIIEWAKTTASDDTTEFPWEFTFDKDTPIYIGDYEFHVDYDIIIRKIKLENSGSTSGKFTYTAKYIIDIENPVSDITNPYLESPISYRTNGMDILIVKCLLRQVEQSTQYKKILSDNSISSKVFTFTFSGQLAAFTIDVTEGTTTTHMVPVYDGLIATDHTYPYFYYNYLDSNTIRVKFDSTSYQPRINSEVQINIQTTQGESGNFTFDPEAYPGYAFESDKYEYSNIGCEIRPIDDEAANGTDRKSIEDLKKIIPVKALSRESITNLTDLENFFNQKNTDDTKVYLYKKRDNALERLYYSFLIMRDAYNVIIPTNTINIRIKASALQTESGSNKLLLKRGSVFKLEDGVGVLVDPEDVPEDYGEDFYYTIPYSYIINYSPLYGMYLLNTMNATKYLDFSYINEKCLYQFIAEKIYWYRGYITDPNTYLLTIDLQQNIIEDNFSLLEYDENGEIVQENIKVVAILYSDEDVPLRWAEAELVSSDTDTSSFRYQFKFTTEDYIDSNNRIRIDTGVKDLGTDTEYYAHFPSNTRCVIHILSQQGTGKDVVSTITDEDNNEETCDLDQYIPNLGNDESGWILSNSYTVVNGIDFFYDYSEIIESVIIAEDDGTYSSNITTSTTDDNTTTDEESDVSTTSLYDDEEDIDDEFLDEEYYSGEADLEAGIMLTSDLDDAENIATSYVPDKSIASDEDDIVTEPDIAEPVVMKANNIFTDVELENDESVVVTIDTTTDPGSGKELDNNTGKVDGEDDNDDGTDDDDTTSTLSGYFYIKSVPVAKADYFDDEDKVEDFCAELISRKSYIDYVLTVLEDAFGVDFKFFNTYGPSHLFTIDHDKTININHVNLSLTFEVKLQTNYNTNIINDITASIKEYVENIDEIDELHTSNLETYITEQYADSVVFFQFKDFNGYGPDVNHIYSLDMPDAVITPEFLNVQALKDGTPDITLTLV